MQSKTSTQDPNAYTIKNDVTCAGSSDSVLIRNVGTIKDAYNKHRTEIRFAKDTSLNTVPVDTEVWTGHAMKLSSTNWATNVASPQGTIIKQWTGASPTIEWIADDDGTDLDGLVKMRVEVYYGASSGTKSTIRYYYRKGLTNITASTYDEFALGQCYDVIERLVPDPDGTAGIYQVWIVDESDATSTLMVDIQGSQIGFADAPSTGFYGKIGQYWGPANRSYTYDINFFGIKQYEGTDAYNVVAP